MEFSFGAYQIAELAMKVEEQGAEFYRQMAELLQDEKAKKLFTLLSSYELQHKEHFRQMAEEEKGRGRVYEYSIDLGGLLEKLIARITNYLFNARSLTQGPLDMAHGVGQAIELEKESIRIYRELRATFIERFHGVLDQMIEEEKEHLEFLTKVKNSL